MTQTLENPYNQATQPKEYQAWYFQNVTKPKREAEKPKRAPEYFKNRQKATKEQLIFNRMSREELIDTIFTPQDEIQPQHYMTYKTVSGDTRERPRSEATELAKKQAEIYHKILQEDPRCHRIIDFLDIIRNNPNFEAVEAFTLLELGFRYYGHRHDMHYYWIKPPQTTTDEEMEAIIPRRTIMVIVPGAEGMMPHLSAHRIIDETEYKELVKKHPKSFKKDYPTYIEQLKTINAQWSEAYNEKMVAHGYTEDTDPEKALWEALKTALDKLRTDWRAATDEARTPLTHRWVSEGKTHQYKEQSALHTIHWEITDTNTDESAKETDLYKIETLPPIPK